MPIFPHDLSIKRLVGYTPNGRLQLFTGDFLAFVFHIKMVWRAFPDCLSCRRERLLWGKQNTPGDFALKR